MTLAVTNQLLSVWFDPKLQPPYTDQLCLLALPSNIAPNARDYLLGLWLAKSDIGSFVAVDKPTKALTVWEDGCTIPTTCYVGPTLLFDRVLAWSPVLVARKGEIL